MNVKSVRLVSVLATMLLASGALAQDLIENVVVRNRLFSTAGTTEVGVNVGFTVMARLTDHIQLNANVAHNFTETLGLQLRGGYALSRHTGLANQVADEFAKNSGVQVANDLADLWEMRANALLGVRWAPVYGKISLMAELPVHFQAYLWLGGGAAQFSRTSVVYCTQGTTTSCDAFLTENKIGPFLSAAVGSRFFLVSNHSIHLEVRDYSYPDSYLVDINRATARSGGQTGTETPNPGITNLVQFDVGYSFTF